MKQVGERQQHAVVAQFPRASARGLIEAASLSRADAKLVAGFLALRREARLKRRGVPLALEESWSWNRSSTQACRVTEADSDETEGRHGLTPLAARYGPIIEL